MYYIHVDFPSIQHFNFETGKDVSPLPSFCKQGYRVHEKIYEDDSRYQSLLDHILYDYPNFKPSYDEDKEQNTLYPYPNLKDL